MGENLLQWHTLAILLAGALAGGFVNGLTGFGTGLTALPLWLQALEPVLAAQLVSAASIVGHVTAIPSIWARVDWRRLAPLLAGGLLGVPIGSWLLPHIPLAAFKIAVGTVLIGYSTFMLIAAGRVRLRGRWPRRRGRALAWPPACSAAWPGCRAPCRPSGRP